MKGKFWVLILLNYLLAGYSGIIHAKAVCEPYQPVTNGCSDFGFDDINFLDIQDIHNNLTNK